MIKYKVDVRGVVDVIEPIDIENDPIINMDDAKLVDIKTDWDFHYREAKKGVETAKRLVDEMRELDREAIRRSKAISLELERILKKYEVNSNES